MIARLKYELFENPLLIVRIGTRLLAVLLVAGTLASIGAVTIIHSAAQATTQQQSNPDTMTITVTKTGWDSYRRAQDLAIQRQATISTNQSAHQAQVAAKMEKIFGQFKKILQYTQPEMVKDADFWYNTNLQHPDGDPNQQITGLQPVQLDVPADGTADANWIAMLKNENKLLADQQAFADQQVQVYAIEMRWLDFLDQFTARLAELLTPAPVTYSTSSVGYGGGGATADRNAPITGGSNPVNPPAKVDNHVNDKPPYQGQTEKLPYTQPSTSDWRK